MIPIRDENPTIHRSIATFTIILLNVLFWIFFQGAGFNPTFIKSVYKYGVIPGELLGIFKVGTEFNVGDGLVYIVEDPNWLTIFTSMFTHGGWLHLIGNMWFLSIFGDNVEDVMGPIRFIIFYLLCGICAEAVQIFFNPTSNIPMVGASGAIGGVMGAYAVLYPMAPVHMLVVFGFYVTRIVVPAFFMLGYWFLMQFLGGFFSLFGPSSKGGIAFWAHIGGFVAGIVLLKFFCNPDRVRECRIKRGRVEKMIRRIRY